MGIKVIKISEEQSILEAMEQMNRTGSKVLFIEKKAGCQQQFQTVISEDGF